MSLLNLVEQHDRVGLAPYFLGKLSAFFVAHISRRCSHQARCVETLAVFAHVDTDQGIFRTEHLLGQFLGKVGLADTRWTQEHECADGVVGVFQSHAVALNGLHHLFDSLVLRNHLFLKLFSHVLQSDAFGLFHPLYGHSAHHRNHIGNFHIGNDFALTTVALTPVLLKVGQFFFKHQLTVTIACGQLEILVLHRLVLLFFHKGDVFLLSDDFRRNLRMLQMNP